MIFDGKSNAVYILVCGAFAKNLLWRTMVGYFFISLPSQIKLGQEVRLFAVEEILLFVDQATMNKVCCWIKNSSYEKTIFQITSITKDFSDTASK